MSLLLHPQTARQLDALAAKKPHAILLQGAKGVGLATIAKHTAERLGTLTDTVMPEAKTKGGVGSIPVARIRELYDYTKGKTQNSHVVIIDDADAMSIEAQNALLKLLEEPVENIHFMLTSHSPEQLLPTIRSRAQTVSVLPIDDVSSVRYLRQIGVTDEKTKQQLLFVASGLPAELYRLHTDASNLESLANTMRQARDFTTGSLYQRLETINALKSDRREALEFIDACLMLLKKSLVNSSDEIILQRIESLLSAKEHILANGNVRLQLASAVL